MELPAKMMVCKYNTALLSGVQLVEKLTPLEAVPPRSGLFGTSYFASAGRLLVRVRACGVNPVDAKYIIGDKFPESWMDWSARRVNGHTPGFDFSGEVVKSPPGCGYKVGDEVYGLADDPTWIFRPGHYMMGSFGQFIQPPINQVAHKPTSLTHVEAAALPLVGVTCVQAFNEHGLKGGQ